MRNSFHNSIQVHQPELNLYESKAKKQDEAILDIPEQEIWKNVADYPGYQISNLGRLRSIDRVIRSSGEGKGSGARTHKGVMKKIRLNRKGYYDTTIWNHRKLKHYMIHRLVAMAFIPNPDNLPAINHINGIKTDNRAENLEWISFSDNTRHAQRMGLKKPRTKESFSEAELSALIKRCSKRCYKHSLEGKLIAEYSSVMEAAAAHNIPRHSLYSAISSKVKRRGFLWTTNPNHVWTFNRKVA